MKSKLIFIGVLVCVFSFISFGLAEEYEVVKQWTLQNDFGGIAIDGQGNVYKSGDNQVEKYTNDGTLIFVLKSTGYECPYTFSGDMRIAIDPWDNIYVLNKDNSNPRIIKFDKEGNYITQWGSSGDGAEQFHQPEDIAIDSLGNVYASDSNDDGSREHYHNKIIKFDKDGTFIEKWGSENDFNEDGADLNAPVAIAIDDSDNIYVTEWWRQRIQVFDSDGNFLRKQEFSNTDDGWFQGPTGIDVDADGNIYVADSNHKHNKVIKYASDFTVLDFWEGYGFDDFKYNGLRDIAVDYAGHLFLIDRQCDDEFGDWQNRRVIKYRVKGSPTVDITNPNEGDVVTGSPLIQADVSVPSGYTLDKVEFYANETKLGEVTSSPFQYSWDTTSTSYPNGSNTVWVIAYNTEGAKTKEKVSVIVANDDSAPTVSITNPSDGDIVRDTIDIQASASDPGGGISEVEFYIDGSKVATYTESPYEYEWDTTAESEGDVDIKVTAYDTIGQKVDNSISVTVNNFEEYGYVDEWSLDSPTGITVDKDGYVYTASCDNRIRKYQPDGTLVFKIENQGGDYNLCCNMRMVIDDEGYIYVSCMENNNILKFDSQGKYVTKWGSFGSENTQFNNPRGITIDSSGNLYICDEGNHRIVKYTSNGSYLDQWGSQGNGDTQFECPRGVAVDSADNIYVVDPCNSIVKVFDTSGSFIRKWGEGGNGNTQFNGPEDIAIDNENYIYIADQQNYRIVKYKSDGTFVTKWGSQGSGNMQFNMPCGIAVDSNGYVYVVDQNPNNRIIKFGSTWKPTVSITSPLDNSVVSDPTSIEVSTESTIGIIKVEFYINDVLKNTDTTSPFAYIWDTTAETDGPCTIKATAYNTQDESNSDEISVIANNSGDAAPTLSITNPSDGDIVRLSADIKATATDDNAVTRVEFYVDGTKVGEDTTSPYEYTWDATSKPDGEVEIKATAFDIIGQNVSESITVNVLNHEEYGYAGEWSLDNPTGIAVDKDGYVYTASCDNRIRKYDADGNSIFSIESSGTNYNLCCNMRLSIDSPGNIYASCSENHTIVKFDFQGKYVTKWGTLGSENTQFNTPRGITIDSSGNLYICDENNHRIVKYTSSGSYLDQWGSQGDGDTQFECPRGIAVDSADNIYVVDNCNRNVKVFDTSGSFIRKWGESGNGNTQFDQPEDIAIDNEDYIYIADTNNRRIVKYSPTGTYLTKWGTLGSSDLQFDWPWGIAVSPDLYVYVIDQGGNNRIMKFRSTWKPTVSITSPLDNSVVSGPTSIEVSTESAIGISKVEFYINDVLENTDTTSPFAYSWDTTVKADGGPYTIKATAYNIKDESNSDEISVIANNSGDELPEVSISNPSEGDTLRRIVTIEADASDDKGVDRVEFYVDDTKVGEDTSSPYEYDWDTESADDGERAVKVIAIDTISQQVEASINVSVHNRDEYLYFNQWSTEWNHKYQFGGNPNSITIDKQGLVYLTFNEQIAIYTANGTFISLIENVANNDDYRLTGSMDITVDDSRNIYVSCSETQKIVKFDSLGNHLKTWGSKGSGDGEFLNPQGLATDSLGNVYVCDAWNHNDQEGNGRIVKFDSSGNFITTLGSQGGNEGQFNYPRDIEIDDLDNVYVVDHWGHNVSVFDSEGTFIRRWGEWGYDDGQLYHPEGMGMDTEGNLYIADSQNHRIVKYSSEGAFLSKWGSQGNGDNNFDWPHDVAVSPAGYVYVIDQNNQRIIVFKLKGLPTVSITGPEADASVSGEVAVGVSAASEYGITSIELFIDGVKIDERTSLASYRNGIQASGMLAGTYEFTWNTSSYLNGSHDIKVTAYNTDGKSSSSEITVVVNNGGDLAPSVSITNLNDGAVVRGEVDIKVEALDDVGIDKVELYINDILEDTDTESAYEFTWDTTAGEDGEKELKAVAYDSIGQKSWERITVTVDNANRIFSIDLSGASVIYITQDHKLKKLDEDGNEAYVINANVRVRQFQFDPQGNLYIVFEQHQELKDGKSYILVKVDPKTNATTGIDSSLQNMVWLEHSTTKNLQFDGEGNIYYFAESQTGEGENQTWMRVLRKYVSEDNIEDIINQNMEIYHWVVRNDGTIVLAGKTLSNNETWLRKINPIETSPDLRVQNITEPDWWWEWGWMANFPDNRIYVTLNGSYLNLQGVYKLADDLHRLTEADAAAPYIGDKPGSQYNFEDLFIGHAEEYCRGLRDTGHVDELVSYGIDDFNNVYGLAGHYYDKYRTVLKLYPSPEIIEPQLIDRALMMDVSLNQLIIAGFNNTQGRYKLLVYDLQTKNELDLMYQNIEVYHLKTLSNGSILFDGLNLGTNKVVIGMFERAGGSANKAAIQADEYVYKELVEVGAESDKPLNFGVIKEHGTADETAVTITSPSNGKTVNGTVGVTAAAAGENGVSKVEFYIDGTLKETDTSSPYTYSWDTSLFTEGSHLVKAIVYDAQSQTAEDQITVFVNRSDPFISLSLSSLNFGAVSSGVKTASQSLRISNTGGGTIAWTVSDDAAWLTCTPESGSGDSSVTVGVDPTGLAVGTYDATLTVSSATASNSPQTVSVSLQVYATGTNAAPFGSFDTPIDQSTVASSVPVTGWVVDDIGIESLKIYRDPVSGEGGSQIYIGDAMFVEGARPDVESLYPDYPLNYQAGWGYMLLTNFLPNQGNGTFVLHAVATDTSGNQVTLGSKTITCDNANAVKPFGAIDTPAQGGTASGTAFVNFGWALTPMPNSIPTDGSTINVFVNGINLGHPVYNNYRSDIATLFPGYANSDGAVGVYMLDTTAYANGVHTIVWSVVDNVGNADGIGSRYFSIFNGSSADKAQANTQGISERVSFNTPMSFEEVISTVPSFDPIAVKKGYREDTAPITLSPDSYGVSTIEIKEVERLEIHITPYPLILNPDSCYSGYLVVGSDLRPLPIGSTLNPYTGIFSWQSGPGFLGEYEFVFIKQTEAGAKEKIKININILPKF